MSKHKKQQAHAKTTLPFTITMGIMKELADMMQVWILNKSLCLPVIGQSSDGILNLHHVDFYIWMKNISPKEDAKLFKQQFWHLFSVPNWFNTLNGNKYSQGGSVNGCMHLSAHKKCLLLECDIEDSDLSQWLGDNISLTAELKKKITELFAEWDVEHICISTT